ncbi:PREDICTED: phosphatidylinositol-glycan biosynthesis class F protein [Camelina sativa]|uniref:Phosphatidylinositol-glycan biosynthesis class F protein n=1 Tax=Camelina sativa TaxID=90675 RepID=A0ABM0Y9I8_CAMSA|nr:PREDICTED: phosphatidylinositol-glycan biosynthesis class F protein [Camelina sativa]
MKEGKKKKPETSIGESISALGAVFVYLITGLFLAVGFWVVRDKYSVDLISDPSLTLRLLWMIEFPIVVIIFSLFRSNPKKCSYFRAVGRSIVGLISGAIINALGAVSLGAPIGLQSLPKTIHWSFLISVFTVVPATAVFGASWTNWHRVFASLKPTGNIEYMILTPAYGAIIGGWFGAWPMPLDWERPWQEWPICVCYGAIGGYVVGQIVSLSLMIFLRKHKNLKLA